MNKMCDWWKHLSVEETRDTIAADLQPLLEETRRLETMYLEGPHAIPGVSEEDRFRLLAYKMGQAARDIESLQRLIKFPPIPAHRTSVLPKLPGEPEPASLPIKEGVTTSVPEAPKEDISPTAAPPLPEEIKEKLVARRAKPTTASTIDPVPEAKAKKANVGTVAPMPQKERNPAPVEKTRKEKTGSWQQYERWVSGDRKGTIRDPDTCWNCGQYGHTRSACQGRRKPHCFHCGRPDCSVRTCPTCGPRWTSPKQGKQSGPPSRRE